MPTYWSGSTVVGTSGGEAAGSSTSQYQKAAEKAYAQGTPIATSDMISLATPGQITITPKQQVQQNTMGSIPSVAANQQQGVIESILGKIDQLVPGQALDTLPLYNKVAETLKANFPTLAAVGGGALAGAAGVSLYNQLTKPKKAKKRKTTKRRTTTKTKRRTKPRKTKPRPGTKAWMKYIRSKRGKKHGTTNNRKRRR